MRKKRVMVPVEEVLSAVKYEEEEFQEPKPGVVMLDEEGKPEERVELALKSLPQYDPASCWNGDSTPSFQYWKISDYAHAYCSGHATPSTKVELLQLKEKSKCRKLRQKTQEQ
ncbi:fatty acid amide hydrolase-like [Ziziphus jujuba]|uniref:Fatty acid amide hydrolase-like n=1 Tax=Ziziphus jujuba TaxID=326968 RepID=A0ABM4AI64_ZIZJJ|nr:fatty acid amide hydrolase-like [Ziziphus jujuba]